ncbi:DUF488 domain-containing protein [Streptomyces sp. NPDC017993]|uniref:DUF488 domain-containing protein n=1 Tax=Streptomyces sp. NPDC017993 TaxID=3365027 RepID=UPI0037999765
MADMSQGNARVRRVYDSPEPSDGARVLVDRLWPRGLSKADAQLTEWCKDVAPSTELRRWYDHREERYEEFAARYRAELAAPQARAALDGLRKRAADGPLTLLTATKETAYSHVSVLLDGLREDS